MKKSDFKIKKFTLVNSFNESVWPICECISLEDFIKQLKEHPEIKTVQMWADGKFRIIWRPKLKRQDWIIWLAEIKGKKSYPIADNLYIAQKAVKDYINQSFYDVANKEYTDILEIYPEMALEMKAILDKYKDKELLRKIEQPNSKGHIYFNEI
jgi:3-polyprenyl-4-hydroxybenzoate decarboxylase